MSERIGAGRTVSGGARAVEGRFLALLDVEDLKRAIDEKPEHLIVFIAHPNVTMIAPIYGRLAGIVCASGDEAAHVAIVARELSLPCAVQVSLERELGDLEGHRVRLEPGGELLLLD